MKKPAFSIVIPMYNKELSVRRAVLSVLAQSIPSFELIIVNDGSTDDSAKLVSMFRDSRLTIIDQPNRGPSAARNQGLESAVADFVCFLDADDEWDSGFLETMSSLIRVAPLAALYSAKYREVNEDGHIFRHAPEFQEGYFGYVSEFFEAYSARGLVNSSSVCIRKKSLMAIGGFPEQARVGEDIYTWLRLGDLHPVAFANVEVVTIYRDAENRSSMSVKPEIPYHIRAVLDGGAMEFTKVNRSKVIRFVVKNTFFHSAGAVLNRDRHVAFTMARKLWRFSHAYSAFVFCAAIMPRILLKALKNRRNAQ